MSIRPPPATALEAFARADWKTIRPKLLRVAASYLRRLGRITLEPDDLLNGAVDRCLSPEHTWVPGTGATEASLMAYLCVTMGSVASNARKSAAVALCSDVDPSEAIDQLADEHPSPSRELAAREQVAHIEQALEGDPEALALHRALCETHAEREELAEMLGWTVKRVKAVRLRASRRLEAMHITLNDDGGEPESGR